MAIVNETRQTLLAKRIKVAENFFERMRGLIGSEPLQKGEGFLIPSCQGVHTFGMTYPIDVVYLDQNTRVIRLCQALPPNTFGKVAFKSRWVIELPGGAIENSGTKVGDRISIHVRNHSPLEIEARDQIPLRFLSFGLA